MHVTGSPHDHQSLFVELSGFEILIELLERLYRGGVEDNVALHVTTQNQLGLAAL